MAERGRSGEPYIVIWYNERNQKCFDQRIGAEVRLVSLLASTTEMIAALGCLDQLVARSHECDYPLDILSLPVMSRGQIETGASSAHIDAQIKRLAQRALDRMTLPCKPYASTRLT